MKREMERGGERYIEDEREGERGRESAGERKGNIKRDGERKRIERGLDF